MKTCRASIACAVMSEPSITRCGTRSMISRSLNAPGSDSSAFTVRYFGFGESRGMKPAFLPVAKNAPPRPRRLEASSSARIAAGSLDRPQRHQAVLGRLARTHPELLLERLHHLLRADECARDVGADLHHMPAHRLQVEHVVEGRD